MRDADGLGPVGPASTAIAVVTAVVTMVLVDPVRRGRLRGTAWPAGLGAVVALALTGLVVAAAVVLTAPLQLRHGEVGVYLAGDLVFPRWTAALFLVLVVLTVSLIHTACLHLAWWLRVASLLVVVLLLHLLVLQPPDLALAPNVVVWVGSAVLVGLTVARWRGSFRWWEFVATFVVVGATAGLCVRLSAGQGQELSFDLTPAVLTTALVLVAGLSVPFTFVAGLAFAQLATLLTHRVADVVDEHVRPTRAVAVVTALVGLVAAALAVTHLTAPTGSGSSHLRERLSAALLLGLAVGAGVAVALRRAPAGGRALDVLEDAVSGAALPIGLLVTATSIPSVVLTVLGNQLDRLGLPGGEAAAEVGQWLFRSEVITVSRLLAGLLLLAWAVRLRCSRPLPALLAATTGVTLVVVSLGPLTGDRLYVAWTSQALTDVAVYAAVVVAAAFTVTRRLTRRRLVALGVVFGLSLAFSVRAAFDAPFVALLGLGATSAVFLGVVWAALTGAGGANADSPRWPQPSRVLLFLGNALLAMTTLAFLAVSSTGEIGVDVSPFAGLGDAYLGTALLLAAYAVLARELTAPQPPR